MRIAPLAPLLMLAACGGGGDDLAPGGVSQSEAAALNDAAAMLDVNSVSANAVVITDPEE